MNPAHLVYRRRPNVPQRFATITLLAALLPAIAFAYTAYLGGYIGHTEIHSDAAASSTADHPGETTIIREAHTGTRAGGDALH